MRQFGENVGAAQMQQEVEPAAAGDSQTQKRLCSEPSAFRRRAVT